MCLLVKHSYLPKYTIRVRNKHILDSTQGGLHDDVIKFLMESINVSFDGQKVNPQTLKKEPEPVSQKVAVPNRFLG